MFVCTALASIGGVDASTPVDGSGGGGGVGVAAVVDGAVADLSEVNVSFGCVVL